MADPLAQQEEALHLVFSSSSRWFAVPAHASSEVVAMPPLSRVPGAAPYLLGVFAHRGEVVPLVDLLQLCSGASGGGRRALIVRTARGAMAVPVEAVVGLHALTGAPAPFGTEGPSVHFSGPAQSGGREVTVVDPEGLLGALDAPAG